MNLGDLFSEDEAFVGQVEESILLRELAMVLGLGYVETQHNSPKPIVRVWYR